MQETRFESAPHSPRLGKWTNPTWKKHSWVVLGPHACLVEAAFSSCNITLQMCGCCLDEGAAHATDVRQARTILAAASPRVTTSSTPCPPPHKLQRWRGTKQLLASDRPPTSVSHSTTPELPAFPACSAPQKRSKRIDTDLRSSLELFTGPRMTTWLLMIPISTTISQHLP